MFFSKFQRYFIWVNISIYGFNNISQFFKFSNRFYNLKCQFQVWTFFLNPWEKMLLKAESAEVWMPADRWECCPWPGSVLTASGLGLKLFLRGSWHKDSLPHLELPLQPSLLIPPATPATTRPTRSLFGNFTPSVFLVLSSRITCLPWEQAASWTIFRICLAPYSSVCM